MTSPNIVDMPGRKEKRSSKIALRRFKPTTLLYHVTRPGCIEEIQRDGLRADAEGNVYLFTDLVAATSIAANQVGADPYAVFWIEAAGVVGKLFEDNVAESTRQLQCIVRQDRIEQQFVHYLGTVKLDRNVLTPWQRLLDTSRGISRQQSEAMFAEILKVNEEMQAGAAK